MDRERLLATFAEEAGELLTESEVLGLDDSVSCESRAGLVVGLVLDVPALLRTAIRQRAVMG